MKFLTVKSSNGWRDLTTISISRLLGDPHQERWMQRSQVSSMTPLSLKKLVGNHGFLGKQSSIHKVRGSEILQVLSEIIVK